MSGHDDALPRESTIPAGSTHAAAEMPSSSAAHRHSSKARFRDFRDRLRSGGETGPDADPNSPARVQRSRSFRTLVVEFWRLLRGRRRRATVVFCVFTILFSVAAGLAAPASTKVVIDYLVTNTPGPAAITGWPAGLARWWTGAEDLTAAPARIRMLWGVCVALLILELVSVTLGSWGRWLMTRLTKRTQSILRRRAFDHAVRLPLSRLQQLKAGGAVSVMREDAGAAAELLFSLLYNPWRAIVQLVGTLTVLAAVDARLLAMSLVTLPLFWFSQKAWIRHIRPVHRAARKTRERIDAHATESFGGIRVVRAFGRERGESARFTAANHLLARQEMLAWFWSRLIEGVWQVAVPVGGVGVLVYGGVGVIQGRLSIGDVMMFSAYLLMLLGPLEALTATATSIQSQLAAFDRLLDLLAEPLEFRDVQLPPAGRSGPIARTIEPMTTTGRITFERVGFTYPGAAEPALLEIDLEVAAGSTVALVGPSGAGKTTLCNLVARFYDPTCGRVLLDGADLRSRPLEQHRRSLGIVEQDVFLFDGSVRDNIAYARRGAPDERIVAAARAANADGFIRRLEHGYQTVIGERGVRLSGGQKQRIAIARALLADPAIMILDEATSNLDSESEHLIQQSLAGLMHSRTCFVIAHRLSTIRRADLIVVLDHGRIIERGRHDDLLARQGRYFAMVLRQLGPEAFDSRELADSEQH